MKLFCSILFIIWVEIVSSKDISRSLENSQKGCNQSCIPENCPKPQYCKGNFVKDHCGCCSICSTDNTNLLDNPYRRKKGACEQVKCPKRRVCMENPQGLPLCTCPNLLICRRRRKPMCGTDGTTYSSRCHMRVTSCSLNKKIRLRHKGACKVKDKLNAMVATQQYGGRVTYPEGEFDIRKRRRKNRRKERRKHRKGNKRRRKRRFRNKYHDKRIKRRQLRRLRLRNRKKKT